jgi:4-diphosphocytidyl-2-C-methyl-D-erythritol kinase
MSTPAIVQTSAAAKINLTLRVGPVEATGYHPLASWMVTVGFFDTLSIAQVATPGIALSCDDPALPCDARNLVYRAAELLRQSVPEPQPDGVQIRLSKRIPSAAGLGGGSSDAAATLLALNRLWQLARSPRQLQPLAAKLGSDVPFFLFAPSALCEGRGEIVTPLAPPRPMHAVLIFPPFGLSTPAVYRRFDEMKLGTTDLSSQPDGADMANRSSRELLEGLVNDLEAPAFSLKPELNQLRQDIEKYIARTVRMSGSGSTLFTLIDDPTEAAETAAKLSDRFAVKAAAATVAPQSESAA